MIKLSDVTKHKKRDWYIEHVSARPLMISSIVRGFTSGFELKEYDLILCYYKNGEVDWITLIEDQNKIGALIINKGLKDWKSIFNKWLKTKKEIESLFYSIKDKNLSKISDKELISDIENYMDLQWESRKTSSATDPFIFYSERKLQQELIKFSRKNKININKAMEILTIPEDPSFINEFELSLIKIAKDIKEKKDINNKIIQHVNKFIWIKVESFFAGKEYKSKDALKEVEDLLKLDLKKEIEKNRLWVRNKKTRKRYISKYKFNKNILNISNLSPLFAKWQDLRKENTLMITYLNTKYLKEMSKRTKIDENDLAYLDYTELKDLIKNKINLSLLKKRKNGCLFVFEKDKFRLWYQKDIAKIINNILFIDKKGVGKISGMTTCPGKTTGRVKVVIKQKDVAKVKKGDILVSTMTRPEHIVAMKKAGAIITNEGGITCHAAIVSRELRIPCIIGTKIATKVLKDGDLVEVDANRGIVKIIK